MDVILYVRNVDDFPELRLVNTGVVWLYDGEGEAGADGRQGDAKLWPVYTAIVNSYSGVLDVGVDDCKGVTRLWPVCSTIVSS